MAPRPAKQAKGSACLAEPLSFMLSRSFSAKSEDLQPNQPKQPLVDLRQTECEFR